MTPGRRLAKRLAQALDPLRRRLRRDEIRALARELAGGMDGGAAAPLLSAALLDRADALAGERARVVAELAATGVAVAAFGPAASLLLDGLDQEAAAERRARDLARLDGQREICLAAAATLAAGEPESADVTRRLAAHGADTAAPWTIRTCALEAAARVLASERRRAPAPQLGAPEPSAARRLGDAPAAASERSNNGGCPDLDFALIQRLEGLAGDAGEHRWVQTSAAAALYAADPARAQRLAHARLAAPRPHPDDALVRARLVRLLAQDPCDSRARAGLVAGAVDPSEHVRQSTARACATCGDSEAGAVLARLGDPACEPTPRVRAVAAQALARRAAGAAGLLESATATEALARMVTDEPDPLARRMACDAAATACSSPTCDTGVREALCTALERARESHLPAPLANAVARAAERARAATQPLRQLLAETAASLAENGSARVHVPFAFTDAELGRALAELAQADFGLYADRRGQTVILRRGERMARRAWRVWHEMTHPIASKRQGHTHTTGRVIDEAHRAHPALLAEVTQTRVPGERVYVAGEGGWANYLPLVDDLIVGVLAGLPARLYSEHGCTVIEPPATLPARVTARAALVSRYAELADLRLRALEAGDPEGRRVFVDALEDLGFRVCFEAWRGRAPIHVLDRIPPIPAALLPVGGLAAHWSGWFDDLLDRGNGIKELAAFTAATAAFLAARSVATRIEIAAARRAVPLVIGGWGTRGKSGVERLKAALFHALGYEVVCKTTGCEATILVGVPGRPLVEVPLFRPYDKATIWEQRDVLRFAGHRRPHALLWECMALNPRYVDLLQRGWMRDDYATLTNAYPDHEDIQGPTGLDVARTIARFTPSAATLVTAEEQMLPIIRQQARERGTRLVAVEPLADELIPPELLARFPYQEHPRNIALVMALAEELGIEPDLALVAMAEHILPDIGGLTRYGPFEVGGRALSFTNGMSANERASALGNWRRCGFDRHTPDAEPRRWIVGFVNNRADRAARTLTFAEHIVEDLAAHRFVLVGSNVSGLRDAILAAWARRLERLRPAELPALLGKLKIGAPTVEAALAELAAWTRRPVGELAELAPLVGAALAVGPTAAGDAALKALEGACGEMLERLGLASAAARETAGFATRSCAARRTAALLGERPDHPDRDRLLTAHFTASLLLPDDPAGPADELLAAVTRACPPGAEIDVMGLQNIKGPGLAMVKWLAAGGPDAPVGAGDPVAARKGRGPFRRAWDRLRGGVDHVASVGRRRRADRIFDDLAAGRMASSAAARAIAALLEDQRPKGPT